MNLIGQQHNKQLENVKSTINFTTTGLQTNVTLNVIGVKKNINNLVNKFMNYFLVLSPKVGILVSKVYEIKFVLAGASL